MSAAQVEVVSMPVRVAPVAARPAVAVEAVRVAVSIDDGPQVLVSQPRVEVSPGPMPAAFEVRAQQVRVVTAGGQGPAGRDGVGGASTFDAENKDVAAFLPGTPVATHPSGVGVVRASAADGTRPCVGLATVGVAPGFAETVLTDGPFALGDWTGVVGQAALPAKGLLFLDPFIPGMLTVTPPVLPGQVNQIIGEALSPDTLDVQIYVPILM